MYQNVELRYVDGSGYQAIELPYTGGELSMLVILPDQGAFAGWAGGLDPALLNEVVSGLATRQVALTLPRFSFTSEVALKEALHRLGMAQAFSDSADFRGMTGQRELFTDEVFHKAFVAVDEEGTEAAAATAVVMGRVSMPLDPIAMVVDSPFLFLIRDVATGTLLFLGHVVNPA
jgi:serpin B